MERLATGALQVDEAQALTRKAIDATEGLDSERITTQLGELVAALPADDPGTRGLHDYLHRH